MRLGSCAWVWPDAAELPRFNNGDASRTRPENYLS